MDVCIHVFVLLTLLIIVSETDGLRFQYFKRYKPKDIKYTPYAYTNYIPFSARKGWRQTSSYITYVPDVRYRRTYMFYRGPYTPHINMYSVMASSEEYKNRYISQDALVCSNYDASELGDVMGIFTCPNAWEPNNFTNCCGQDYAEFCCDQTTTTSSWVTIFAATAGIVAAIVIVVVVVLVCLQKRKRREKATTGRTFTGKINLATPPKLRLAGHSGGVKDKRSSTGQPPVGDDSVKT